MGEKGLLGVVASYGGKGIVMRWDVAEATKVYGYESYCSVAGSREREMTRLCSVSYLFTPAL